MQDGKKIVRKRKFLNVDDFNNMQQELIDLLIHKFNLKNFLISEIRPVLNNNDTNSKLTFVLTLSTKVTGILKNFRC